MLRGRRRPYLLEGGHQPLIVEVAQLIIDLAYVIDDILKLVRRMREQR